MEINEDLFGDVRDDSLLEHLGDETENVRFPSILSELNAILSRELERLGGDPALSLELVIAITRHIGGMQVYVPRGQRLEFLVRDMKIWRDYCNRMSIDALVVRYHVTYKTVYKAIRRMRRLEHKKYQPSLF